MFIYWKEYSQIKTKYEGFGTFSVDISTVFL